MKLSHRIFYYFLKDDILFDRILEWTKINIDAIDEIALIFDESCVGYRTDEKVLEEAEVCKRRMQQLREAGVKSVGINVLSTIGHGDEAWGWLEMPPFQTAVDPYGKISFGQLCPRDENAIEYIRRKYQQIIKTNPDFIWVDDDLRVPYHGGVNCACFCDRCVEKFNKIANTKYRRSSLTAALNNSENKDLRRKWIKYNLEAYININAVVHDEVEKAGADIKLGFMTVHIPQNAKMFCDMNALVDALGAKMVRPGGGFYLDTSLFSMIEKICGITYQNAVMADVPERMYELEDFPATVPHKSVRTHITESALAIMAGCDGIMTNSMPPCEGTSPIYQAYGKNRRCYELMAKRMRETKLIGARALFSNQIDVHIKTDDWFSSCKSGGEEGERIIALEETFMQNGFLPFADPLYDAHITFISGEMARAISDEEIKKIFSRSVFMDGEAASILNKRGFGNLTGCDAGVRYDNGLASFYTEHVLNAGVENERRDTRMTYSNKNVSMSLVLNDRAQALAKLVSITGQKLGVCECAFENELGGRVIVMGFDPWRFPNMWHRKKQLKNIFEWLWNGNAPYTGVDGDCIFQMYRESTDKNKFMLMLTNMWEDTSDEMKISLANTFSDDICIYKGKGVFEKIDKKDTYIENGRRIVRIPEMESHTFVLIMNDCEI